MHRAPALNQADLTFARRSITRDFNIGRARLLLLAALPPYPIRFKYWHYSETTQDIGHITMVEMASNKLVRAERVFTRSAQIALIYWLLKYVLLDGWRLLRAKGLSGAGRGAYVQIKNVRSITTTVRPASCCMMQKCQDEIQANVQVVVRLMLALPSSQRQITSELAKARSDLVNKLAPSQYPDGIVLHRTRTMPESGKSREWLEEEWRNLKLLERGDVDGGRVSGTVYHVRCSVFLTLIMLQMVYGRTCGRRVEMIAPGCGI